MLHKVRKDYETEKGPSYSHFYLQQHYRGSGNLDLRETDIFDSGSDEKWSDFGHITQNKWLCPLTVGVSKTKSPWSEMNG